MLATFIHSELLLTLNNLEKITQTACLFRAPLCSRLLALCLRGGFNVFRWVGLRTFKEKQFSWPCLQYSSFTFPFNSGANYFPRVECMLLMVCQDDFRENEIPIIV